MSPRSRVLAELRSLSAASSDFSTSGTNDFSLIVNIASARNRWPATNGGESASAASIVAIGSPT